MQEQSGQIKWVVLDAMGVMYRHGDDVGELVIPFLRSRGCELPEDMIVREYVYCATGRITSDQFWTACGMDNCDGFDMELTFLYSLNPGLLYTLPILRDKGLRVACLSNDTAEWSRLLRRRFGLEKWIEKWVISGEVRCRKPAPEIYHKLFAATCASPGECLFVDDRQRNLDAAKALGMQTMLFAGKTSAQLFADILARASCAC